MRLPKDTIVNAAHVTLINQLMNTPIGLAESYRLGCGMTDRERALGALDDLRNWETRPDLRELLADAMLRFAANEPRNDDARGAHRSRYRRC